MARAQTAASRRAIGLDLDDAGFRRGLAQAVRQLELRSERQLEILGLRVQNEARRLCPVDTGRLRASIMKGDLQRDARGAYVEVGTNVNYAGFVEFGTSRSPAQPFMRPALIAAARTFGRRA